MTRHADDPQTIPVLDLKNIDLPQLKHGRIDAMAGKAAVEYIQKAVALAMEGRVGPSSLHRSTRRPSTRPGSIMPAIPNSYPSHRDQRILPCFWPMDLSAFPM